MRNFSLVWLLVVNYKLHLCMSDVLHAPSHRAERARNTENVIAYMGSETDEYPTGKKIFRIISIKGRKTYVNATHNIAYRFRSKSTVFYFVCSFSTDSDAVALHILH